MNIIIITPFRNEEKYIRTTLESMAAQTILPKKWILVNDGSTDQTENIINGFIEKAPYIEYLALSDRGYRKPAEGVISTFYKGYNLIGSISYDIIAKFDADLKFPPDTLEIICKAFQDNPKLGITGGTRYEKLKNDGPLVKAKVPKGFVGGPFKFYRKECFKDINGLIKRAGWDGVDTIKANMKGWETGEIGNLKIIHLKPTGTAKGEGLKKAFEKYGDVSHYMGGYFWYFLLRVFGRSLEHGKPYLAYYILKGYFRSMYHRYPRESKKFRGYLKSVQINNLKYFIKYFINRFITKDESILRSYTEN